MSLTEKRFLDDAVHAAARVKGKRLTAEERRKVLCVAREQIRSQRKAEQIKNERNKEKFIKMDVLVFTSNINNINIQSFR